MSYNCKLEITILAIEKQDLDRTKSHFMTLLKIMQKSEYPSTINWVEKTIIDGDKI